MRTEPSRNRNWAAGVVGGFAGALSGVIVALNVMIYSGVEDGYEAGLGQLFEHSGVAGTVAVAALVLGPVLGVLTALWIRRSG